jgi:hypothetical protein
VLTEAAINAVSRRDRAIVIAAIATICVVSWAYVLWLAGQMNMMEVPASVPSAGGMTGMTGMAHRGGFTAVCYGSRFFERRKSRLRRAELNPELLDGVHQVAAPKRGGFCNRRIGEVPRIAIVRTILFGAHLAIELGSEALEISDHGAGLRDLAPACGDLKVCQAHLRDQRVHRSPRLRFLPPHRRRSFGPRKNPLDGFSLLQTLGGGPTPRNAAMVFA